MSIRVFISYKTGVDNGLTALASLIQEFLTNKGFDVWRDQLSMKAGKDWNSQLHDAVRSVDVLVLLLVPEIIESDWVRREVDIAKGALTGILPIVMKSEGDSLEKTLAKFDISFKQAIKYSGTEDEKRKIIESIKELADEARQNRMQVFANGTPKIPFKTPKLEANLYDVPDVDSDRCRLAISQGDMLRMPAGKKGGVDVIVSSENNYMQMARFFDPNSLSKQLRLRGAHADDADIIEDTVQFEVYRQLSREDKKYRIPVRPGRIIPTRAGHPESDLARDTKARYIFHVSSIDVDLDSKRQRPYRVIEPDRIVEAVKNCFRLVVAINENKGAIFENEPAEKNYKPIKSIIFPIFGTGHAGVSGERGITDIVTAIVSGVEEYLPMFCNDYTEDEFTLKRIYLSAYSQQDYDIIKSVLDSKFK